MSRRSTRRTAWISALLALYMVMLLPACWTGALERARWLFERNAVSSNNNEEREEHEHEEGEVRAAASRSADPPSSVARRIAAAHRIAAPHHAVRIAASVALPPLPSRFSERRLI